MPASRCAEQGFVALAHCSPRSCSLHQGGCLSVCISSGSAPNSLAPRPEPAFAGHLTAHQVPRARPAAACAAAPPGLPATARSRGAGSTASSLGMCCVLCMHPGLAIFDSSWHQSITIISFMSPALVPCRSLWTRTSLGRMHCKAWFTSERPWGTAMAAGHESRPACSLLCRVASQQRFLPA